MLICIYYLVQDNVFIFMSLLISPKLRCSSVYLLISLKLTFSRFFLFSSLFFDYYEVDFKYDCFFTNLKSI